MPLVSVIVNAHNGAQTLAATLDSVLAQSFADYELLLWDDASRDTTAAIARRYQPRGLRYLRTDGDKPLGLGAARQAALQAAQGEWVAYIDQDDLWLPRALELQVAAAQQHPRVGLVYGRTLRFWPEGRERDFDHLHEHSALPEGELFMRLWQESCFICISGTLMRREAMLATGGIPEAIRIVPDYFFFLEISRQWQVRAVQQVTCRYRMHAASMSNETRARMQAEILWLIDRWRAVLPPGLADRRWRVHSTVWAVEELRRSGQRQAGWQRLRRDGSLAFLLSRPLAWAVRECKRRLRQPYWQRLGMAA